MKRQSVLVVLVEEEELVVGGSGESHKKLKAGIQEESVFASVCANACVCVCEGQRGGLCARVLGRGSNPPSLHR